MAQRQPGVRQPAGLAQRPQLHRAHGRDLGRRVGATGERERERERDPGAGRAASRWPQESRPRRYGTLEHQGDQFSFDIFTQGGLAVRGKGKGPKPLAGYDLKRVIAIGESQSAFRMTTYVNAVHPLVHVFDGFLIHSRGGQSAPFGAQQLGQKIPGIPNGVKIRTDLDVPVLTFETEGDLVVLGFGPATQRDSKSFHLWEAAGTSHADAYFLLALSDLGDGSAEANMRIPPMRPADA